MKKQWLRPTLLEFNDWLQEKADTHDRMKAVKFKTKTDETPVVNKTNNFKGFRVKLKSCRRKTEEPVNKKRERTWLPALQGKSPNLEMPEIQR